MSPITLITGASRGIGAATAVLAARHGWHAAVHYSASEDAAGEVAQAVQAGVADETQVLAMFARRAQEVAEAIYWLMPDPGGYSTATTIDCSGSR